VEAFAPLVATELLDASARDAGIVPPPKRVRPVRPLACHSWSTA
jgi:hypothetical protein